MGATDRTVAEPNTMHHDFDSRELGPDVIVEARGESTTERLGARLAELLPDGAVVALIGTLGAGKTRLVQAIAVACGVPREQVVSPTFILCHEYYGDRTIYHLDAYRLSGSDEFRQLGVEDFIAGPSLTLIEWADRVLDALPDQHWRIEIHVVDPDTRRFEISTPSDSSPELLARLRAALANGDLS